MVITTIFTYSMPLRIPIPNTHYRQYHHTNILRQRKISPYSARDVAAQKFIHKSTKHLFFWVNDKELKLLRTNTKHLITEPENEQLDQKKYLQELPQTVRHKEYRSNNLQRNTRCDRIPVTAAGQKAYSEEKEAN